MLGGGQDARTAMSFPEFVQELFLLMPGWLAYGLTIWSQRFVAGYFLYRLLRDELALGPWAAIYGGTTYALFSQNSINHDWAGFNMGESFGMPGVPATIWALARIGGHRGVTRWLAAAGLGILVALGSDFPFAVFFFLVWFGWFAVIKPRRDFGFWALFTVFGLAWLMAEAHLVWASALNAPLSHRADWAAVAGEKSQYADIALGLIRDNKLSILLLGLGLAFGRFRDRRLNVLAAVVAVILIYVAAYPFVRDVILMRLGFPSGFNFSRISDLAPFFCATAGAAALPSILLGGELQLIWRRRIVAAFAAPVLVALLAIVLTAQSSVEIEKGILRDMLAGENYSAFYRNPELLALARDYGDAPPFRVATICPIGVNIHPGMLWAYGLSTADGYLNLYPERYQQFWGEVIRRVTSKYPLIYDYFHSWGNRIYLFWPEPSERGSEPARFSDFYDLELLSLANVRFLVSPVPLSDDRLTLIRSGPEDASDADRTAADQPRLRTRLRRYLEDGARPLRLFIYENREVIPRIFLAFRTRLFGGREELLSALAEASREELASTAFLLRGEAGGIDLGSPSGEGVAVQVKVLQAERIVVSVNADRPGILVVTQNYSPFWKVRIDGTEGRVIPVDHTFQGVGLAAGQHEVELTYRPPYALY
jgi:hypothetical protein